MSKRKWKSNCSDEEPEKEVPQGQETEPEYCKKVGNNVYFYGDVNSKNILKLNTLLDELSVEILGRWVKFNSVGGPDRIKLFINSGGGDVFSGLSCMDHISTLSIPVDTVIDGLAGSAATFICMGGKKRYIRRNSIVLIHQMSTEFWGTFENLKDEMKNSEALMTIITNIYKEKTQLPRKKIKEIFTREIYLTSQEAIQYDIAQEYYLKEISFKRKKKST